MVYQAPSGPAVGSRHHLGHWPGHQNCGEDRQFFSPRRAVGQGLGWRCLLDFVGMMGALGVVCTCAGLFGMMIPTELRSKPLCSC